MAKGTLSEFVEGLGAPDVPPSNSPHEVYGLVKKTHYFRPDQLKALRLEAAERDVGISEVIRDAVDCYLAHEGEPQ